MAICCEAHVLSNPTENLARFKYYNHIGVVIAVVV